VREPLRASAVALVAVLLAMAAFGRLRPSTWKEPLVYGGDYFAFLAGVKAARDGHVTPLWPIHIPELNAPYGADWNDFPNRQPTLLWVTGLLARPLGLFAAVNVVTLVGPGLSALVFYLVARRLRVRWEWAAAGAVVFALSPVFFLRAPIHLALVLYWHLPWCLLVSAWAFSRRGLATQGRIVSSLGAAVAAGLGNFYYAALFVQLLLIGALAQVLRRRPRAAVAPLVVAAVLVGTLAAENAYYLSYRFTHGPNPGAVTRGYGDVERFALKPLELLLARPGRGFLDWGAPFAFYWSSTSVIGEKGGAYLGLVGAGCLFVLLFRPFLAAIRRRPVLLSPAFLAATWVLAFSVVGGGNGLSSLVAPPWLRATNRFSIVLLALALLSAAIAASRARFLRPPTARILVAIAVAAFAVRDHATGAGQAIARAGRLREPADDEAFTRQVEARLPRDGMVFMLPVQPFPEWPTPYLMGDYEHFRPYFFTSRLRFSYGADRGRPRDDWQAAVEALPPAAMVEALEGYGFSGIVLNRSGLPHEGEELLRGLGAVGRPAALARGNLVLVVLEPRPEASLP
jgi:hypothetical protein